MKKLILFIIIFGAFNWTQIAYAWKANFNYGRDTYEKWDNILIVNSLGDETSESQCNHNEKALGNNDYIPENAFKNNLYNEGYSKVYDTNSSLLDLTEVGYMGKLGDPRKYDTDYVLTKEYNKYSSQKQNIRINNNKTNIQKNKTDINTNANNIRKNTDRISTLEETEYNVMGEINLIQGRRYKIGAYGKYDIRHNNCPEAGLKITFSLGDSWETKELEKLNKKLNNIVKKLNKYNIETEKIEIENGNYRLQIKKKKEAIKFINNL